MAKKNKTKSIETFPNVFSAHNYKWMIIGLVCIFLGFFLMIGADANTVNGVYDPDSWNQDIFSWRRIRLAPTLVVLGFCIQVYAIMSKSIDNE